MYSVELRLNNPAAADYFIAVIEYCGLARSYGALGFIEGGVYFGAVLLVRCMQCFECGPGGLVAVTDLDLHAHRTSERRNADPVAAVGAEGARGQLGVGAYGDTVAVGVDA